MFDTSSTRHRMLMQPGLTRYPHSTNKSRLSRSRIPSRKNFMEHTGPTHKQTLRNNDHIICHNGRLSARRATINLLQSAESEGEIKRWSHEEDMLDKLGAVQLRLKMEHRNENPDDPEPDHYQPRVRKLMRRKFQHHPLQNHHR
jgi:hypothetical protein